MDLVKITKLQLKLMSEIDISGLKPIDKVKYGKILISNFKKSKEIVKSGTDHSLYWEDILKMSQKGLEDLVDCLENMIMIEDEELTDTIIISYSDILTQIKYLEFQDDTNYGTYDENKIDFSKYGDLIE